VPAYPARIVPPPPPAWPSWELIMTEALAEAALAAAEEETPVGALLLSGDGRILGRGRNAPESRCDPTAHAEVLALRAAALTEGNYRLEGSVLVVTLEPCLMCVGAAIQARIAGLVYGAADQRAGAVDSRLEGFEQGFLNHRVWSLGGILRDECSGVLREFFARRRG
jgi:tRNA(adenine34) deaminase